MVIVPSAKSVKTKYDNVEYFRIGSSKEKLSKFPEYDIKLSNILVNDIPTIVNTPAPDYAQELTFEKMFMYYGAKGITLRKDTFEKTLKLKTKDKQYNVMAYILSDQNSIPIRVSVFTGTDKVSPLFSVKEFGNTCIMYSMDKILEYGDASNIIQADERNRKLTREDVPLFDIKTFKEAIINAFVHNKWIDGDAPQVEFYQDRVEILSHGKLIPEQTKEGFFKGQSKPVNKSLSTIFIQLHISEKTGRGVPTIVKKYGRKVFSFNDNSIVVTIPFNWINVVDYDVGNKIGEEIGEKLTKTQINVLNEIRNNPNITTLALMSILGVSETTVENSLAKLKKMGYIKRVGSNKSGYWEVLKK